MTEFEREIKKVFLGRTILLDLAVSAAREIVGKACNSENERHQQRQETSRYFFHTRLFRKGYKAILNLSFFLLAVNS